MESEDKNKQMNNHSDNDERSEEPIISGEALDELEIEEPLPTVQLQNICSWLLIFTPNELVVIASILAIIIANGLTIEEKGVIGAFFATFSEDLFVIAAQETLINAALDEQKQIDDREREIKRRHIEKIKRQKEKLEQEQKDLEIKEMKEKIKKLEDLINKQLRL